MEKLKTYFNRAKEILKQLSNGKAADGVMRWPRPVAFALMVAMFLYGWSNPAALLAFAQAISALPADFWTVVYIVLGSIGISKGANDIAKIISSRTKP